jgi:transcriptional regulator with XRE-family HTH domain
MKLSELISSKRLTVTEFADSIGVSRQAVHAWTSGRKQPSTESLFKIRDKYGVEPEELGYCFESERITYIESLQSRIVELEREAA